MTTFNHVTDIGQRDIVSSLEDNVKSFLDWSFLNIGGFINVGIPISTTSGPYKLTPISGDPSVVYPRTWESTRKDWIYETGVTYNNTHPTNISGINLNGTFLPAPTGSGAYTFWINYPLGRVTFNNNIAANSNITLAYSFRFVQVYKANENSWWKDIQDNQYNPSNVLAGSGTSYLANGMQLPAIVIETAPRSISIPHELGSTANILRQDLLLHIFTENPVQRNNLIDIMLKQKDKTLNLYNINKLVKNNRQSLNYRGEANSNRLNYDQIVNDNAFIFKRCYIHNAILSEIQSFSSTLHHGVIRWTMEIFP
jgi:hypothetical protein